MQGRKNRVGRKTVKLNGGLPSLDDTKINMTPTKVFHTNSLSDQNITHRGSATKKRLGFLVGEAWGIHVRFPHSYPPLVDHTAQFSGGMGRKESSQTAFRLLTSTIK